MIPSERAHLHVVAQTHPGMSGKINEDRYAVSAYRSEGEIPLPSVFAIVSDGIGGHRAGEIAAEIAVETISQSVAASDGSQPIQTLKEAIQRASQEILLLAESDIEKRGMGATCACAWILDDRLYIASAGDSRIYLIRGENITQISTDHTWVQEAIQAGIVDPEQAREHPNAHVIRRYLGSRQLVEPDVRLRLNADESEAQAEANQGLRLLPGDQVFLCSDGLTDLVNADEILTALNNHSQQEALERLIDLANQRGGHDNITLISLQVPEALPQAAPTVRIKPKRRSSRSCTIIILLVLLIGILLAGGAYLYWTQPWRVEIAPTMTVYAPASPPVVQPTIPPVTPEATATTVPTTMPSQVSTPTVESIQTQPAATLTYWSTNTTSP